MRQFAGFGTAEETNEASATCSTTARRALHRLLRHADADGLRLRPRAPLGEVGREGVADRPARGHGDALPRHPARRGLDLDDDQPPAAILLAFYIAVGEEQVCRPELRGTIQTDILKEYIAQKEYIFSPEPSMRLVTDMVEYRAQSCRWHRSRSPATTSARPARRPRRSSHSRSGRVHVRRGGRARPRRGRLRAASSFFFNAHLDFFEEIAKYRAARRIWARELRDCFGARTTLVVDALPHADRRRLPDRAAAGGEHRPDGDRGARRGARHASRHANSFDEALALPTEDAVRIALRTQQVIAHETGVVNTIDPLGGAYHVEELTNRIEAQAAEYFGRIEKLGGMVEAIKQNFPQRDSRRCVPLSERGGAGRAGRGRRQSLCAGGRGRWRSSRSTPPSRRSRSSA